MQNLQLLLSLQSFLIDSPPYVLRRCSLQSYAELFFKEIRVDAHCCACGERSTFSSVLVDAKVLGAAISQQQSLVGAQLLNLECARNPAHNLVLCLHANLQEKPKRPDDELHVQKIGQEPSYADIAQAQIRDFRKAFPSPQDAREFNKAVGLAAHGVGIGSFVYLRRVFERLISRRFEELKAREGWSEEDFRKARMDGKIEMMKSNLPTFMVENKNVYSILSLGIHELEEEDCLAISEIMQSSILYILKEDDAKRKDRAMKSKIAEELSKFRAKKVL